MATAAFEKVGLNTNICVFSGRDITLDGALPEELQDKECLPSLLFLNLDAIHNLFHYFSEVVKSWVDVVEKIVMDEVHTLDTNSASGYPPFTMTASFAPTIPLILSSSFRPFCLRLVGRGAETKVLSPLQLALS